MMRTAAPFVTALAALLVAGCATAPHGAASCDRDCLLEDIHIYVEALIDHDPSKAPLARNVVTVENLERIRPGEGLWATASGARDSFILLIPDPVAQSVGFLGLMRLDDRQELVAIRLKLQNGKIVEAEHLLSGPISDDNLANLQTLRPGLRTEVPSDERMSRDELARIGASYYDALVGESGKLAPFADDCVRRENGLQTSTDPTWEGDAGHWHRALGCSAQLDTGVMAYIDSIDNRRVFAADPVTGLAIGFSQFRHSMAQRDFPVTGGPPGVTSRHLDNAPFDMPAAHVFKIADGEIHEIEAMGFIAPYDSPTGWGSE